MIQGKPTSRLERMMKLRSQMKALQPTEGLCRLMCGRSLTFRSRAFLRFGAMPRIVQARLKGAALQIIAGSTEGHRPSAHQAAKPRRALAFKRQRAASFYRRLGLTAIALFLFLAIVDWQPTAQANHESEKSAPDERAALIESALYTRVEFFSAQALVPYPTGDARNRLAAVQAKYPNDSTIELKLSQLDEKLGRETE